jgi:cell division protease FtsH
MYSRTTHSSRVRRLRFLCLAPIALIGALALAGCDRAPEGTELPYSALKQRIAAGEVREVRLSTSRIDAVPTDAARAAGAPQRWQATPVPGDAELLRLMDSKGVIYHAEGPARVSVGAIIAVVAMLALVALVGVHLRTLNPARGALGMGRSKLRDARARSSTRFQDVAGVDEAREELEEIVRFLRQPAKFVALGARTPKGVLLVGPPGTGKTLLARAVAGEANVPFFSVSGSEFLEVFVGVGASRVRRLFRQAKAQAPAIIFIDELDAIGKSRSATSGSGANDEREHTLNQLLVEMDGFDPREGLIIMGATNRAETLDAALLRPGRFDRQVLVDRPDASGREAILRVHARKLQLDPDVDLAILARRTPGFVGADLENLLNEAALLAARADKSSIGMVELEAAIDRVVAGLEKKQKRISDKERRIVAYHEAGHAIVAELAPTAEPVRKVSIVPRGLAALGYVQQTQEERHLLQEDELRDRLAVLLGGRAAEHIIFRQLSTGASNDLERATALARRMVCEFGMSAAVGPVAFANPAGGRRQSGDEPSGWSEQVTAQIEQEVQRLLSAAFDQACAALSHRRVALDDVAMALLERGNLDRDELLQLMARTAP